MSPARLIYAAKALRGFGDGFATLLLPVYLLTLGMGPWQVGLVATAALAGSAAMTLGVGLAGHQASARRLLMAACGLMLATGLAFSQFHAFWPLLLVAFLGTLNPSAGDVSVFVPLEQALLADAGAGENRAQRFAVYGFTGAGAGALGALGVGLVDPLALGLSVPRLAVIEAAFALYGLLAIGALALYARLPATRPAEAPAPGPLGPSRGVVYRLAVLFSLDSFGGGFFVTSLLALWLFQRFDLSLADAGHFFFWTSLLGAASQFASVWLARRIGLINTMVFTHIPASLCMAAAAFVPSLPIAIGLLSIRALLSNMDVPVRSAYVMAVVTPAERTAAAGVTNVPRSLAAAVSPALAGWLYGLSPFAWPLVIGGALKITYDLLLLAQFRHVKPEEGGDQTT